jgi:uncharacterized protein (TIGR02001 family)
LAFLAALAPAGLTHAQTPVPNLSGYVTLGSGYWQRGLAQNDGTALSLGIDFAHPSGFFTYARATNVDFDVEYYGQTRDVEASAYVGYHDRRGAWSWTASLGRYFYPGTGGRYDYNELEASVGWRNRVFYSAAYIPDYYGAASAARSHEVAVAFPLRADLEIGGSVGYFDAASVAAEITYWDVGVSKLLRRVALDVRYYDSNYNEVGFLGAYDPNRVVVSVSYALRRKGAGGPP